MQIEKQDAEIGVLSLAEKEGFEPSRRLSQPTPLAGEPLRPLGYFSKPKNAFSILPVEKMAERVGFEPTDACTSPVFKTGSFDHSDISPFSRSGILT